MKKLRIVFFGTPEFAVASLDALRAAGHDIAAVVTMPDKAGGRGNRVIESDVKKYAMAAGLPLLQPEKLKDEVFVDSLRAIGADLFVVIAFRMLPQVVWSMPPMGTVNLHGSLLPRYRGAAPINRAVMAGDSTTGVSTFLLKHEIDTGDVLMRRSLEIGPDENAGSVHDRLMELGAATIVDTVAALADGTAAPVPQELLDAEPCPAPKIFREDCRIDWTRPEAEIHNHVRGLAPYPAAWTEIERDGRADSLKILATRRRAGARGNLEPGRVAADGHDIIAGTGDGGSIVLLTVQPAGKKAMPAADWFRGLHAADGATVVLH